MIDPPNGKPAPHHPIAPVTVPLADAVSLRGASDSVEGLVRFILLQLAIVPSASGMRVLLAGGVSELLLAARFLPRTSIVTHEMLIDPSKIQEALAACGRAAVVILPGLPGTAARSLVDAAIAQGACIVDAAGVCDTSGTTIYVHGSSAHLRTRRRELDFVPDLVPMRAFSITARRWGAQAHMDDGGMLPARCSLDELIGLREADLIESWTPTASAPNRPSLRIPVGIGSSGTTALDLISDGPHVLVAGTTGSGKSEFLRTLVAGAAASHTPDRLTFLFMDFKGGSGLEPLAGLPHCVGLVSDLEGGMDRTLISLRAELVRRERQLAATRCADLDEYSSRGSDHEPLPRLVIVIDEFRMLIDQAPDALAELMRVATIGRSLGLHLVMATQRPQGAVSADIRANVGCVIALRVAGEAESRDVIGSPSAAHIPALVPGRALISVAGADPLPFQTASLGLAGQRAQRTRIVRAEQWMSSTSHDDSASPRASSAQAAAPFVADVLRAWRTLGGRAPRRPVAAPLPASARPPGPVEGTLIPLGIADSPHQQRTGVLNWDPENDGHLALIGEAAGGSSSALSAITAQLAAGQRERHLYLLDADGGLEGLQCHARVGAYVNLQDARRAARVIARLVEEGGNRRARPMPNGISARVNQPSDVTFQSEIENRPEAGRPAAQGSSASASSPCGPTLILVVAGWGSWIAAFRQGQPWVEDALLELVRGGPACGIVVLVAGARELVSSRAIAGLPGRLYFPRGTTDEARYDWPKVPSTAWEAGRAIASGVISPETAVAVQCFDALPVSSPPSSGSSYGSRTLLSSRSPGQPADSLPFRIVPLPRLAVAAEIADRRNGRRNAAVRTRPLSLFLTVGLAGDEADPLALRVRRGELLLVLGAPGSGKSSFLAALPAMNPELRWHRASSARSSSDAASAASRDVSSTLLPVLLVDDAER
ncbi:MAG: hypothetical protein HOQ07_08135 [Sinomonas sp.]|nr:hypothetical protein [Sinomonas sp.]